MEGLLGEGVDISSDWGSMQLCLSYSFRRLFVVIMRLCFCRRINRKR